MAANTLATSTIVCKKGLAILQNMVSFSNAVSRDYEIEFTSNQSRGYSPGQTVLIKRPPRFTYRAGRIAVPQATVESTMSLTVQQGGTDLNFTSLDKTLLLQGKNDKIVAAMAAVANEIDRQGLDMVRTSVANSVGTPGTPPAAGQASVTLMAQANQKLDEMGAPRKDKLRALIMSPALNTTMVGGLSGLFNSQAKLDKQYNSGLFVDALGFNVEMDQNVSTHTLGTQAGGATANAINGAGQVGNLNNPQVAMTLNVRAVLTAGTITRGTVITIAGVNAVNPQSRVSTGALQQFVVQADVAISASVGTISILPSIITSGAFQNCSASPADNATVTILGTASTGYPLSVLFHKDAFQLACVPMVMPTGGVISAHQETDNGFSMRVIETYDSINDNFLLRIDVLFAWAAPYPELGCRVYI